MCVQSVKCVSVSVNVGARAIASLTLCERKRLCFVWHVLCVESCFWCAVRAVWRLLRVVCGACGVFAYDRNSGNRLRAKREKRGS